jgi:hypothetical protein
MPNKHFFKQFKKFHLITAFIVILIVAGIGTYLLTGSHAATPYVSTTADTGTLTGNAAKQACSGAVDGNCVAFNPNSSGGGTGTNSSVIIGLNDYAGWGSGPATLYYNDGFRWDRIDGCPSSTELNEGINMIAILPLTSSSDGAGDVTSCMDQWNTSTYASRIIYEFDNEPFYNGVSATTYAQDYQAAYTAKHAANIVQPLLFMTTGDPSGDYGSNTWLDEALDAVPSLQVDGFSVHPYGEVNQNTGTNSNGVGAVLALRQDAVNKGFANTPWYLTEFGFTLCTPESATSCTTNTTTAGGWYVPSECEQEKQLQLTYNALLAYGDGTSGTWLKGIWWYQTHDDSTGEFGIMDTPGGGGTPANETDNAGDNLGAGTSSTPRPAYTALKGYLTSNSETPVSCSD